MDSDFIKEDRPLFYFLYNLFKKKTREDVNKDIHFRDLKRSTCDGGVTGCVGPTGFVGHSGYVGGERKGK